MRRLQQNLFAALTFAATAVSVQAQATAPISAEEAKKALQTKTRINICADVDSQTFGDIKVGTPEAWKPLWGAQVTDKITPIKTSYTVHCTQGNRDMRHGPVQEWNIEVEGVFGVYRDAFGDIEVANNFDDGSSDWQLWNNEHAEVHCRGKSPAWLTYDASGKVISSKPEEATKYYGYCMVRLTAR